MKQGRYFQIPETPGDVDRLRRAAARLDPATLPAWLDASDAALYGCVGDVAVKASSDEERAALRAETRELNMAGLVVDRGGAAPETCRVYVPAQCGYPHWSIGIFAGSSPLDLHPVAGVANPALTRDDVTDVAAVFVADPFMVRRASTWFMFFELLNWRENKGEIGLATSEDGLHWQYRQRVLEEPFHLSYPHVFSDGDDWLMIPEARQSGGVRLYRAAAFPTGWSLEATLLEGPDWVDASVFRHDDRWWMFVGARHDTLHLFMADAPAGPWTRHPQSPIVERNARIARPAGRVLDMDGRTLRFAQNCDIEYGQDVSAFEIVELTPHKYREVPAATESILKGSGDGWNARGMHHLDAHRLGDGTYIACVDGWSA